MLSVCWEGFDLLPCWESISCDAERCPSGLRSTLGKRVLGKLNRGFESHSLRHIHFPSLIARILMTCPKCNAPLVPKPVPGALKFPQRLECPVHGWLPERITPIRMRFHKDRPDW